MIGMAARSHLESLLRARKLDVTLLSAKQAVSPRGEDLASVGVADIDAALGGGLRRGHLSELVGPRSSGRTSVMFAAMRAVMADTSRDGPGKDGELVALIDTNDRFDPASAASAGLELSRLLWIREAGDVSRALKAMNLVLQAGGFGLVVFDLADVPGPTVRALPFTTWFRLARVIEGSQTVALLVADEHLARSSGGATITLESSTRAPRAVWTGASNRARLLQGLDVKARVI